MVRSPRFKIFVNSHLKSKICKSTGGSWIFSLNIFVCLYSSVWYVSKEKVLWHINLEFVLNCFWLGYYFNHWARYLREQILFVLFTLLIVFNIPLLNRVSMGLGRRRFLTWHLLPLIKIQCLVRHALVALSYSICFLFASLSLVELTLANVELQRW